MTPLGQTGVPIELFSDHESATGTGQVHVWFERPERGWTG